MPKGKPFVIYKDECPVEIRPDNANPHVRWWTLVSSDRRESDSLTLGIAEIKPGDASAMRFHWHDPSEIYFVLSGEGIVKIDDEEHPISPGATIFIPGKCWHATRNTGSEPLQLLYAFGVSSFEEVEYHYKKRA
ncbi:MAG: cupin domain-containing protein [Myxococcota bacterium]